MRIINHMQLTQALKKNREEYGNQVAGINQSVDSANTVAQASINATHANLQKKIAELEQKKSFLTRISAGDTRNAPGRERRASERPKNSEIHKIDEQLERLYQVLAVTTGSTLHIKATSLETGARLKYDTALEGKTAKDAEALKKSQSIYARHRLTMMCDDAGGRLKTHAIENRQPASSPLSSSAAQHALLRAWQPDSQSVIGWLNPGRKLYRQCRMIYVMADVS
ncbi:MAG: hypothetical protein WC340_03985 [Kiritimatiellia bacterium]